MLATKLNYDVAVLGLHAIKEKPVAVNGKVEIRPVGALLQEQKPS